MRRLCLLFLLFVLPVQMSWAAVHDCATGVRGSSPLVELAADYGESVVSAASEPSSDAPDFGHGNTVHACDGIHDLVADETGCAAVAAGTDRHRPALSIFLPGAVSPRLERPQWPAA